MKYFIVLLLFVYNVFAQSDNIKFNESVDRIKKNTESLANDVFEGRGTGTLGGELAAKYIAYNLNKYNLTPLGRNNTFYQYLPMHGSKPEKGSKVIIFNNTQRDTFNILEDYAIINSGGKIFAPNPIPLVFVGYGITAPEFNYDDYKHVNVEHKIAVFIDGEPKSKFGLPENSYATIYAGTESKQRIALAHGAVGSILLPLQKCKTETDWIALRNQYDFEDVSLAYSPTPHLGIVMNPFSAERLLSDKGISIEQLRKMQSKEDLFSFSLSSKITLNNIFEYRDFVSPNVAAILEGSDEGLKDQYIVVTAHYDHLGIGPMIDGDNIYNGFLDNAIGTAALMELSRLFANLDQAPKRSIVFLFVTGEEKGLLGSKYYTDHPLVPINQTIAAINIDGMAVFDEFKSIIGIGSEFSSLDKALEETAKLNGLSIQTMPPEFNSWESFARSDQLSFAQAGIPSILIAEGFEYTNNNSEDGIKAFKNYIDHRYHSPKDDSSIRINYNAVKQHLKFYFDFINNLANSNEVPKWYENSPFK